METGLVAQAFGVDRATLYRWMQSYQLEGDSGLYRKPGSGRPRILEALTEVELRRIILCPASDFGYETDLWTSKRVQAVIADRHQIQVSTDTIWRRLRGAGLTYQKPERQYFELDERAREAWARREIPRIRRTVLEFRAILYFQDEANVSPHSVSREDLGAAGAHAKGQGYWEAGRGRSHVCNQPSRAPAL